MGVSKEASRVLLNLTDVETVSGILSVGQQASLERTLLAANAAADTVADINGVGESNSGRTRSTLSSLVDVCGGCGGRLVLAAEAVNLNVVADEVQLAVDTDLEETRCTGETTSGSCAVDDLVGSGLDLVVRGELEGRGNCLGAFGRCSGAAFRVVDGPPATGGSRVGREVLSGALGVCDRFPTA